MKKNSKSRLDNLKTHMGNLGASMKSLEIQVEQLANALKEKPSSSFPLIDIEPNAWN